MQRTICFYVTRREKPVPAANSLRVKAGIAAAGGGTNLRKESQGKERDPASIQARAIDHVVALEDWDIVLDDDGTGEVADIVAIRMDGSDLRVLLVHCKYSSQDFSGSRVRTCMTSAARPKNRSGGGTTSMTCWPG